MQKLCINMCTTTTENCYGIKKIKKAPKQKYLKKLNLKTVKPHAGHVQERSRTRSRYIPEILATAQACMNGLTFCRSGA